MKVSLLLCQPARAAPYFESRHPLEKLMLRDGSLSLPANLSWSIRCVHSAPTLWRHLTDDRVKGTVGVLESRNSGGACEARQRSFRAAGVSRDLISWELEAAKEALAQAEFLATIRVAPSPATLLQTHLGVGLLVINTPSTMILSWTFSRRSAGVTGGPARRATEGSRPRVRRGRRLKMQPIPIRPRRAQAWLSRSRYTTKLTANAT
jgi:hypothetical protein